MGVKGNPPEKKKEEQVKAAEKKQWSIQYCKRSSSEALYKPWVD
jgi:hypothetical protein